MDGIPITVRAWNTEELLNLSEVTDRFHVPAIETQNKSAFDSNDLEQPVGGRRQSERKRRQCRKWFG